MKYLPEFSDVTVIPLCQLTKMPNAILRMIYKPMRSKCKLRNYPPKVAGELHSPGNIGFEIMAALFVISLTFTAFISVTDHLKHLGDQLRIRGEGMTALNSRYEMGVLGYPFFPSLPEPVKLCQQDSDVYQRIWLAITTVEQRAHCNTPDPMSLVLRKHSP